ncbi:S53 family peptidase [Actinospica sp.]|uniref:S53 family peptidase n=1 Tax=Actinospica sp. TaxID=1872142 RepID=UPI002C7EB43C|nr:protease pro-enzyme activation domain-containing protein [Actinospica sp.]HWG27045.1 protease pro-enzyme activation domain-containing protein [Actinospica sp.]
MGKTWSGTVATLAVGAVAAATSVVLGVPGTAQAAAASSEVPGSAARVARAGTLVGAVSSSQRETVQVWLSPDVADATAFANAVSTPGNPEFHHYLSPAAYTARFGPTTVHAAAVAAWLTSEGLTDVHAGDGRDYVSATGPAAKVQAALQVRINTYRVTGATGMPEMIQADDRAVSVPTALASDVQAVTGLDGAPPITSQTAATPSPTCAQYWAQYVRSFHPAYHGLTTGSLPICGYSADQLRAAYGATTTATGKGQTVAMIEDEAPIAMFQSLTDFAKANKLPAPTSSQFRQVQAGSAGSAGNGSSCGAASVGSSAADAPAAAADQPRYNDESEMDSEALYTMAPGADQLMVTAAAGCDENQGLLDAALSVLTGNGAHPSATIESNSWQIPDGAVSPETVHAIDLRAAGEGVGMYFSSGDAPGLAATASDPFVTAVGGTTLGIGSKSERLFETGWSDDLASVDNGAWSDVGGDGGAGGGTSLRYAQPAYQKGVVPASMSHVTVGKKTVVDRAVPDIAADADLNTGMLVGYIESETKGKPGPFQTQVNAGTSLACPLVAGLVADAQQGQKSAFGFINPLIYSVAGTSALHDILPVGTSMPQQDRDAYSPANGSNPASLDTFDYQDPSYTTQVTAKGYDTMTGIGAPNGAAFINALRKGAH